MLSALSDCVAMAPPDPENLRSSSRAPLRLRVDYERMNSFFADYTKNISRGGTFIKTPRPLPVGTRCQFSFTLPALSDPLVLEGEVTWLLGPGDSGEPGMGVKFVFEADGARREFEELVEKMMEESLGPETTKALLHR